MTKVIVGYYDADGNLRHEEREPVPTEQQTGAEWFERWYDEWLVNNALTVVLPEEPKGKRKRKRA